MTRLTSLDWPTVAAAYDFTPYGTIVDIGGGHGQLLALMLGAAPGANGVLVERKSLLTAAEQRIREAGVPPAPGSRRARSSTPRRTTATCTS